jgi:hypothetical protein
VSVAEFCIRCAQPRTVLDPYTGFCVVCTARLKLDAQRIADDEEEARLAAEEAAAMEELEREGDAIKKARQRMREQYNANPRKRGSRPDR